MVGQRPHDAQRVCDALNLNAGFRVVEHVFQVDDAATRLRFERLVRFIFRLAHYRVVDADAQARRDRCDSAHSHEQGAAFHGIVFYTNKTPQNYNACTTAREQAVSLHVLLCCCAVVL